MLGVLDEDTCEETDEVRRVDDGVWRLGGHRDSDGLNEFVVPESIPLGNLVRHATTRGVLVLLSKD